MDYDDSKIDDDLDKLLQHIKEEQQNSMVLFLIILNIFNEYFITYLLFLRMHLIHQKLNHLLVHQLVDWIQMIHQQIPMIICINADHLDTYYTQHISLYHW